jgi:DNA-binding NarL/FixJ family response regulator
MLERDVPSPLSSDSVHERFGLTAREVVIAGLVEQGLANAAIGHSLGITIHTVRRHVEHILMKLAVHSRAAVGAKLRECSTEPERRLG